MKKVLIEEMSWVEFGEIMLENDLIIFPVGSVEEHGPHNPLGTDNLIALAAAKAIGERANAPVAPLMPVGNARNLMGFPGTATIDPQLLREVMVQVCEGFMKHGAKRFLFINGHGGNTAALKMVGSDLYLEHGVFSTQTEWWLTLRQMSEFKCNDHGGKFETSMMLATDESLVDMSRTSTVPRKALTEEIMFKDALEYAGAPVPSPVTMEKISPIGNTGAPAEEASLELGQQMFEVYVDYCVGLAEQLRKVHLR